MKDKDISYEIISRLERFVEDIAQYGLHRKFCEETEKAERRLRARASNTLICHRELMKYMSQQDGMPS